MVARAIPGGASRLFGEMLRSDPLIGAMAKPAGDVYDCSILSGVAGGIAGFAL